MKVLFLTNHLRGDDGWSRVSRDFIEEFKKAGHSVFYFTKQLLDEPSKHLANPLISFSIARKINKRIKELSPDIIHFMAEPYANCLPFLDTGKIKTFLTVHGTYSVIPLLMRNPFKKIIAKFLSKKYYQRLDGIVAVSNYTKDYLLNYYPELKNKVRVITNGVDLEKNPLINLAEKPQNAIKKILFVGTVKERKGILESIEACRYYGDNFLQDFIYNIVGSYGLDDKCYQTACRRIEDYGLENKVFFRGVVDERELENYYTEADLFLMPSLNIENNFEGFGLVYLEANARGVPCIGSRDSGAKEAILEGKTGYLVNPCDPREIAQKIDLVLNKGSIRREDCISWAKQNDIKIKAKELLNFYARR